MKMRIDKSSERSGRADCKDGGIVHMLICALFFRSLASASNDVKIWLSSDVSLLREYVNSHLKKFPQI